MRNSLYLEEQWTESSLESVTLELSRHLQGLARKTLVSPLGLVMTRMSLPCISQQGETTGFFVKVPTVAVLRQFMWSTGMCPCQALGPPQAKDPATSHCMRGCRKDPSELLPALH